MVDKLSEEKKIKNKKKGTMRLHVQRITQVNEEHDEDLGVMAFGLVRGQS